MKILLKTNCENEEEILKEFLYLAIYTPPDGDPPKREVLNHPDLARYYLHWGRKDDRALFAFFSQQIIGACWSRCFPKEEPGYGTLDPDIPELSIAVLPEYRSLGVGTTLLEKLLSRLQLDYTAVSLSVNVANPAVKLYQRFGFLKVDEEEGSIIMINKFDQ